MLPSCRIRFYNAEENHVEKQQKNKIKRVFIIGSDDCVWDTGVAGVQYHAFVSKPDVIVGKYDGIVLSCTK